MIRTRSGLPATGGMYRSDRSPDALRARREPANGGWMREKSQVSRYVARTMATTRTGQDSRADSPSDSDSEPVVAAAGDDASTTDRVPALDAPPGKRPTRSSIIAWIFAVLVLGGLLIPIAATNITERPLVGDQSNFVLQ